LIFRIKRANMARVPYLRPYYRKATISITSHVQGVRLNHTILLGRGDENENHIGVVSPGYGASTHAVSSFLPFDFGSSFGTISQGIHGFLPTLEGSDVAVPKVHILHLRLKTMCANSSQTAVSIKFTVSPH